MKNILALMLTLVVTFWVVKDSKNAEVDNATIEVRSCHCGKGSKLIAKFETKEGYTSCVDSNGCLDISPDNNNPIASTEGLNSVNRCTKP
jgi:hypothetical protein